MNALLVHKSCMATDTRKTAREPRIRAPFVYIIHFFRQVSLFLRYLNSILKTFASALEICLSAILSYVFFATPISAQQVSAIAVVCVAVLLYSKDTLVGGGGGEGAAPSSTSPSVEGERAGNTKTKDKHV